MILVWLAVCSHLLRDLQPNGGWVKHVYRRHRIMSSMCGEQAMPETCLGPGRESYQDHV